MPPEQPMTPAPVNPPTPVAPPQPVVPANPVNPVPPAPTPLSSPAPVVNTPSSPPPGPPTRPAAPVSSTPPKPPVAMGKIIGIVLAVILGLTLAIIGGLFFVSNQAGTTQKSKLKVEVEGWRTDTNNLSGTAEQELDAGIKVIDSRIASQPKLQSIPLGEVLSPSYKESLTLTKEYTELLEKIKIAALENKDYIKLSTILTKAGEELNVFATKLSRSTTSKSDLLASLDKIDGYNTEIKALTFSDQGNTLKNTITDSMTTITSSYRELINNPATTVSFGTAVGKATAAAQNLKTSIEGDTYLKEYSTKLAALKDRRMELEKKLGSTVQAKDAH